MSTPPPFAYTALSSPTNIRLIWNEPGSDGDPIALSLFEGLLLKPATTNDPNQELRVALQDAVQLSAKTSNAAPLTEYLPMFWKYEALSYVWGDEKDKLEIMIDNKPFMVTRNLHDFLIQMRPKSGVPSVRAGPFWIDAISINQNDNEKGAQVNMIGDIYRNCARCIVWLGKEEDDSTSAFDLMKAVEDYTCYLQAAGFERQLSWEGSPHLENRDKVVPAHESDPLVALSESLGYQNRSIKLVPPPDPLEERLVKYPMWSRKSQSLPLFLVNPAWAPISKPEAWEALLRLFTRSYFFRIWTKQESILSKEILWHCGSKSCDRTTIDIMSKALRALSSRQELPPRFNNITGASAFQAAMVVSFQRHLYQTRAIREKMYGPRDIYKRYLLGNVVYNSVYYATDPRDKIFGLLGLGNDDPLFKADYNLDVRAVYHAFAVRQMKLGHGLVVLLHADIPRTIRGLPSWVPDWSTSGEVHSAFLTVLDDIYIGAGTGLKVEIGPSYDLYALHAKGCLVDTVKTVVKLHLPQVKEVNHFPLLAEIARILDHTVFTLKPGYNSRRDILLRTICLDTIYPNGKRMRAPLFPPMIESTFLLAGHGGQIRSSHTNGRSLIITHSGHAALASSSTRPMDFICVFAGLRIPFILRPKDRYVRRILRFLNILPPIAREWALARVVVPSKATWAMVGAAYVHGIMDGEIPQEVKRKERLMQTFEIP